MNEGEHLSNTKTTIIVLGAATFIAGCFLRKTEKLDNGNKNIKPSPVALVGAAAYFVPLLMKSPKNKYTQAIEIFNRQ